MLLAGSIYWYGFSLEINAFLERHVCRWRADDIPVFSADDGVSCGVLSRCQGRTRTPLIFWAAWRDPTQQTGRLPVRTDRDRAHYAAQDQHGRDLSVQSAGFLSGENPSSSRSCFRRGSYFIFRWIVELVARWWLTRRRGAMNKRGHNGERHRRIKIGRDFRRTCLAPHWHVVPAPA